MPLWETKEILVLGSTYPSYSHKYTETVCTGGLQKDDLSMVRLHPVPHRYLDSDQRFKAFQWIRAQVTKNVSDPRPESLRIKEDSIELLDEIPPTDPEARRDLLERSPHFCTSVEDLYDKNSAIRASLGIVRPAEILGVKITKRPDSERAEWKTKERQVLAQLRLEGDDLKELSFPEARFMISWRCNDERCTKHEMSLSTWGLHELYRKLAADPERDRKTYEAIRRQLNEQQRDVFLFLGNYRGRMDNFGLMDSYSPSRRTQRKLFDGLPD
jgi:hypothetical protein